MLMNPNRIFGFMFFYWGRCWEVGGSSPGNAALESDVYSPNIPLLEGCDVVSLNHCTQSYPCNNICKESR